MIGCLFIASFVVSTFLVQLTNFVAKMLLPETVWNAARNKPIVQVGLGGAVVFALIGLSILISYNIAALLYQKLRKPISVEVPRPFTPAPSDHPTGLSMAARHLQSFQRIGIVLAGGGAKGAYQAGAMKAIYEFLAANDCLKKVRMISGTSIGSWNAMFWLSDLVVSGNGQRSAMETWWKNISIKRIIEFDTYLPFEKNSFLLSTPWQENFDALFNQSPVRDHMARLFTCGRDAAAQPGEPIHFYFTRSNVGSAQLEFATNSVHVRGVTSAHRRTITFRPDRYEIIDLDNVNKCLDRAKAGVFASMDLPPLFPYASVTTDMTEEFEDGGVIDNLPILFGTQIEECDLLFILPLNATFADEINRTSLAHRLLRVMDVRQGVLEQNSLKMMYLYNELAEAKAALAAAGSGQPTSLAKRTARPVSAFVICPGGTLAIGTGEFWKTAQAGTAFDLMYAQTKSELETNFHTLARPEKIQMVVIGPQGQRSVIEDF
jgi:predicted acylesterase/phospholipase RssA